MSWQSWEKAAESGPEALFMKGIGYFIMIAIMVALVVMPVGCVLGWLKGAAEVVQQELNPQALLKKYQWFKDASAALDAKEASIKVYLVRFENLKKAYGAEPRSKWSREDREQSNLWESELAGIKASYNSLSAEYNSKMAQINWAFCNAGELPRGADKVLPREYRQYLDN